MIPAAIRHGARRLPARLFLALAVVTCLIATARAGEPILTFDFAPGAALPKNFRLADGGTDPGRPGITHRLSGSSEFDAPALDHLAATLPRPLLIVDLRQESHGFLDGTPVVWFAPRDQANCGKTPSEAAEDEAARLAALRHTDSVQVTLVEQKAADGGIQTSREQTVTYRQVSSEAELVAARGIGYLRLFVTDEMAPDAAQVDRYLAALRDMPPDTWVHVHCHAGRGRTTTFMVLFALLRNPEGTSLEDIAAKQAALGGATLLGHPKNGWQKPLYLAREAFLRDFAAYAAKNPGGGPLTYGQWLQAR